MGYEVKKDWPKKSLSWQIGRTKYISIPFTWELPVEMDYRIGPKDYYRNIAAAILLIAGLLCLEYLLNRLPLMANFNFSPSL